MMMQSVRTVMVQWKIHLRLTKICRVKDWALLELPTGSKTYIDKGQNCSAKTRL